MLNIAVENVIVCAEFPHVLDLNAIEKALPESRRQSRKFPGLVYRFARPAVTILMFETGKAICTGGKTEQEAKLAVEKLIEKLREKGISVAEPELSVENVVVSTNIGRRLNLEKLAPAMHLSYEPERFPGATFKREGKTFLLFSSGRVVCVGSKTLAEAKEQLEKLAQELQSA